MNLTLERFYYGEHGTLGKILELDVYVLERPWLDNAVSISCIPESTYEIKPDEEGRYTGFQELQNVPGRSEIIIHAANHVHEVQGCLAPGLSYSIEDGKPHVWDSTKALDKVFTAAPETITITSKQAVL